MGEKNPASNSVNEIYQQFEDEIQPRGTDFQYINEDYEVDLTFTGRVPIIGEDRDLRHAIPDFHYLIWFLILFTLQTAMDEVIRIEVRKRRSENGSSSEGNNSRHAEEELAELVDDVYSQLLEKIDESDEIPEPDKEEVKRELVEMGLRDSTADELSKEFKKITEAKLKEDARE